MGSVRIDPFFYKQPPLGFVEDLRKPIHTEKHQWFGRRQPVKGEVLAQGAFVVQNFDDKEGFLETAIQDFQLFLRVEKVGGDRYPIILTKAQTPCFEAYRILVKEEACMIEADDTEGIRRALIYVEDEMLRREGAILPLGEIVRRPIIRTRITRGFFSPTNRPPMNVDELLDDVDYYPDEYLNRLAHDGTNGIWIYTRFKDLLPSEIFPEYRKNWKIRIEKLRRVVAKCKRYGVKVYVFGVEPAALLPDMAKKYGEAIGYQSKDQDYTMCTYSRKGAAYCIETTQKLLELVPDLGGIIDITHGERFTSCSSAHDHRLCPRCRKYSKGQVLAHTVDLFQEGIRRSGRNAEFISWTYAHRRWAMEDIQEYVKCAPKDAMLMENFEDAGYEEQLGKTRQAVDYWLSYVGPSQMFEGAAKTAMEEGKHMFAKMQVCCSHELATVPYIPVPGILFDKYARATRYGVEGVVQCWYFGNYPSLMSKAAGELSFMTDFSDKEKFLLQLAGIYYGSKAKEAVDAWKHFEEGYKNYPINIMFSYYGPMHDSVVWELALLPRDTSLPRTWQLLDKPDGDRIGECLQSGHTLNEAVILTERMCREWLEGMKALPINTPMEQHSVAAAISILLKSGKNILRFYELRTLLAKNCTDGEKLLTEMEAIVEAEIRNSQEMIPLCEEDSRLGYHSEAEGYKFFPEKLRDRIEKLKKMKIQEFSQVRERLKEGKPPLVWYLGEEAPSCKMVHKEDTKLPFKAISEQASFRAFYDDEKLYLELQGKPETSFIVYFEYEPMWPAPGIIIENGQINLTSYAYVQSVFGERIGQELEKYELTVSEPSKGHYVLAVARTKAGWIQDRPLRILIKADGISWVKDEDPVYELGKGDASPGEFGWLLPKHC